MNAPKLKHLCILARSIMLLGLCLFFLPCTSQNIGINNIGASPDASAILDINASPANNKGFLLPKLTNVQRNAIASPATGLIIFNSDTKRLNYWNGSQWNELQVNTITYANPAGSNTGNGVSINIASATPHHSALLEVTGNTGGVLIPRMSTAQRAAIASPATGLIVYNTTSNNISYYNGSQWIEPCGIGVSSTTGSVVNTQNVAINSTNAAPDPSSLLDISSTNKGILVPRITTANRNSMFSPAEGLMIYNTTSNTINIFAGSNTWLDLNPAPAITTQPANSPILCAGNNTSFSVTATGVGLTYQWQVSTDGGATWNNISLAGSNPTYANWSTATLSVSSVILANNGYRYRCLVSGTCSPPATSNDAILIVDPCSGPPPSPVFTGNNCPIWAWDCPPSWIFTINNNGAAYYEMYIVASPSAPAICTATGTISNIAAGTYNYCDLLTANGKPCCRWPGLCGTTGYICSIQIRACNGPGNCSAWSTISSGCIANYSDDNCAFTDFSK